MASLLPLTLVGDNLGHRHCYLNSVVREVKESGASVQDVEALPEESAVDRLFKIDLARQLKLIDYIIRNLKDDDMLYVSRALKAKWLVEHRDIINPKYLEDVLFPEMITPAITKMKHWLYINLRDPAMCQEFYQHYKENTFEFAIKFLSHCIHGFIHEEVPKILTKLTTHSLKVLCEKCPRVAKIYFDSLPKNEDLKTRYLEQDRSYYNSVKCVLKIDADVFLDITEKYFNMNRFNRFSPVATDYILCYHKTRFTNKLELYVRYFLHIPTLAARLSVDECQAVVVKLARASYLKGWFEYKVVEPLIKRLSPDKRPKFKKRVFVDKDVGDCEDKWPYEIPAPPTESDTDPHVFDDKHLISVRALISGDDFLSRLGMCYKENFLKRHKCLKSELCRLFDEFRFVGFDRALRELGQRLGATGSADRRRDIFLVLVSKSGGRADTVSAVLNLAAKHSNEPPHIRASILRSLVKRASVWNLPADDWKKMLDFGHGLGLEGASSEAACREGLHSVVIRQLLAGECKQAVRDAFLKDFSTLIEYSLKVDERMRVADGLQNMLAEAAINVDPPVAAEYLGRLLKVLKVYRIRIEATSPAVKAAVELASRDAVVARPVLEQLYDARIARRELLRLNMEFRKDEAALVNALRHDPSVLELKRVVDIMAARQTSFDRFTSKLAVYFQKLDFTVDLKKGLKEKIPQHQIEKLKNVKLARPLASLVYQDFENELREFDAAGKESAKFVEALRACAHRARPVVNLAEWGWRKAGVKAVATRAMRCREIERDALTRALMAERRTVRIALALSMRSTSRLLLETLASAAKLHPAVALRAVLPYFRRHGVSSNLKIWDIVKPLISSINLESHKRLHHLLGNTDWIPSIIKPDYCVTFYLALNKISIYNDENVLRDLLKLLPECDESIEVILLQMLDDDADKNITAIPYPTIFVRYLLLSRNEEDVGRRFMKIGNRFLERLETLRLENDYRFQRRLNQIMESLKYNSAFLDAKFASCLSVLERFLAWTQKFMPKDKYFDSYTQVRLTMLYFKAIRQSMKQMPEVFGDPKRRKSEGVEAAGFAFGRYIMKEVAELLSTYFDSIVELFTDGLANYLSSNIMYGTSRNIFIGFVLKGILTEAVGIQRRVAVYILREYQIAIEDSVRKEIEEMIMNDKALECFIHAELFSPVVPVVPYYNNFQIRN